MSGITRSTQKIYWLLKKSKFEEVFYIIQEDCKTTNLPTEIGVRFRHFEGFGSLRAYGLSDDSFGGRFLSEMRQSPQFNTFQYFSIEILVNPSGLANPSFYASKNLGKP